MKPTPGLCVYNNRVCLSGIAKTKGGHVPYFVSVPIEGEQTESGPASFGEEGPVGEAAQSAIRKAKRQIRRHSLTNVARDLVVRARAGDQNAMAMIAAVRIAAKQPGNKKAQNAFAVLKQQVNSEDVLSNRQTPNQAVLAALDQVANSKLHYGTAVLSILPGIGPESEDAAISILADGPNIAGERWADLKDVASYDNPGYRGQRVLNEARKIQKIRAGLPFEKICKYMAWEYPDDENTV